MSDPHTNSPNIADPESPNLPPPGNGNGNGHPLPLRITSIAPIGGLLAGGFDVTLTGIGFQPEAEVFFGAVASPEVQVIGPGRVTAKVPPATQVGTVSVSLVNPDGESANAPGGFTYVSSEGSLHAEVLGVSPLSVIEDTETEITLRGRNLISAFNDGIVALRGPSRVQVTSSNFGSSSDPDTGIESLILTVRITAAPPLQQHERIAIQVLASLRPDAANNGIFTSSRQMFTVLPRAVPVVLAFTANLDPGRPNLVIVAGRNLDGISLDLGGGATIHSQRSDDRTIAAVVTLPAGTPPTESLSLQLRDPSGQSAGQFDVTVVQSLESATSASSSDGTVTAAAESGGGGVGLTLTPVPGQQLTGPTKEDSAVFSLTGQSLFPTWGFDGFFFYDEFDIDILIPLFNEVRLIPFFDNGVGDLIDNTPVVAQVGKLFRLRGVGLLVTLRVDLIIRIHVVIIIGIIFFPWNFGFFNEFYDDYPWGIGSIVISIRITIQVFLALAFMVALVEPGGHLRVLFFFNLELGVDFFFSADNHVLQFDTNLHFKVDYTKVSPFHNLLPCDGRFQLAEENGRSVFTDNVGGTVAFYFPRAAGQCCLSWDFDLRLVQFGEGGPEEIVQDSFRTEFCLNAAAPTNVVNIIVTSEHPAPTGIPRHLQMTLNDRAALKALAEPADADGSPTGQPQDVRDLGYDPEFLLEPLFPDLFNPVLFPSGDAIPVQPGNNTIHVKLHPRDQNTQLFSFRPADVVGFVIQSFISQGLMPEVIAGALPVTVQDPTKIIVEPILAFRDPTATDPLRLSKCPEVTNAPAGTLEMERYEPFEAQREFVLAIEVDTSGLTASRTVTFNVHSFQITPSEPLAGTSIGGNREGENRIEAFFSTVLDESQLVSAEVNPGDTLVPLKQGTTTLTITPYNVEADVATGQMPNLVPPGFNVMNRHVVLSVELEVRNGANVIMSKSKLDMAVRNDETFEEYLRVLKEVRTILAGSGALGFGAKFSGFGQTFFNALNGHDLGSELLAQQGKQLWKDAYEKVQGVNQVAVKDDRPLYWARLQGIGALRAYSKRKATPLTAQELEQAINQFEWTSRGMDLNGRILFDGVSGLTRKVIVTGFDPFGLFDPFHLPVHPDPDRSNPSGLIALEFNMKSVGSTQPPAHVRTAIFPVRYKEFDAGWIENAFDTIDLLVMLMTTSENRGRDFYDVERWAGKNRLNGSVDNNNLRATGTPVTTNFLDPIGPFGKEFLRSTLPYKEVLTVQAIRRLKGPSLDDTPFVIDQSYRVIDTTATTFTAGEFRPEPNATEEAGFIEQPDGPDSSRKAALGSGGNYLSNEIFYRTAQKRDVSRPSLASGHFHVPSTDNAPQTTGLKLVEGVSVALGKFADALSILQPRITSFSPLAGRAGDTVTIIGERLDGAVGVLIGLTNLDIHTFTVVGPTKITARVSAEAHTGQISVITPYGTAVSADVFHVTTGFQVNMASASNGAVVTAQNFTQDNVFPGAHFQPAFAMDGLRYMHLTANDADGFWRDEHGLSSWLQVDFNGTKVINEVDVFTAADYPAYLTQADPSPTQTFTSFGITAFDVQYWTGNAWATVPGGSITGNNLLWRKITFPAVTTQKIRVVVNAVADGVARVVELEAWGTSAPPRSNVASAPNGAVVSAQNFTQDNVFPGYHWQPSFAVDGQRYCHLIQSGNDGTGVWRDEHGLSSWLQVDFNGAKTIDEVDVFTVADYPALLTQADPSPTQTFTQFGITAFDVQYWTGSAWATVPGGSITGNNLLWRKITFPAVTTQKIRVVVNAAADGVARIAELEAWGTDAP